MGEAETQSTQPEAVGQGSQMPLGPPLPSKTLYLLSWQGVGWLLQVTLTLTRRDLTGNICHSSLAPEESFKMTWGMEPCASVPP